MMSGVVSGAALVGWSDLLPRQGVDAQFLCDELQIDLSGCADGRVGLPKFVQFLEVAATQIKRSEFFWRAGEVYDLSLLRPIGGEVLSSRTLGGALKKFAAYFSLLQDSSEMTFSVDDQFATIGYRILDPSIWPRSSDAEFTLGIVSKLIRSVVKYEWRHAEVVFELDSPRWGHGISDYLQTNCGYGGVRNMIRIPVSWLNLPVGLKSENLALRRALNEQVVVQRRSTPIEELVRYLVFKSIGIADVDQTTIAKEMGMSRRTLRRKLERKESSFQVIVDQCRMEATVLELQRRPDASIAELAVQLGYTEHSSFTRAFRRWNEMSPQQYRCVTNAEEPSPQLVIAAE